MDRIECPSCHQRDLPIMSGNVTAVRCQNCGAVYECDEPMPPARYHGPVDLEQRPAARP